MISVSIVTACFNDLANLKRTHACLTVQTDKNFEWIVVDGGSVDGTMAWLENLNACDFKIKFISEDDRGISDAWNKGIFMCESKMILILNAGDIYYPEFVENILKNLNYNKIITFPANVVNENGFKVGLYKSQPEKLCMGMYVPHNWCAVPISFYNEFGGYKEIPYSMDFEWFLRYFNKYGSDGFSVLDYVGGEYSLGGISDKGYMKSFNSNRKIMLENKINPFFAHYIFVISVLRHFIRRTLNKCMGIFN